MSGLVHAIQVVVQRLDGDDVSAELGGEQRVEAYVGADVEHVGVADLGERAQKRAHIGRLPQAGELELGAEVAIEARLVYAHAHVHHRLAHARLHALERPPALHRLAHVVEVHAVAELGDDEANGWRLLLPLQLLRLCFTVGPYDGLDYDGRFE